jgi:hypothetical protein
MFVFYSDYSSSTLFIKLFYSRSCHLIYEGMDIYLIFIFISNVRFSCASESVTTKCEVMTGMLRSGRKIIAVDTSGIMDTGGRDVRDEVTKAIAALSPGLKLHPQFPLRISVSRLGKNACFLQRLFFFHTVHKAL